MAHPLGVPAPVALTVRRPSRLVPVLGASEPPAADCSRLDVYRVAVEFQLLAVAVGSGRALGALRGQLDRASVSIVLNIAEGSGRFAPADKAHFYLMARGSAMECHAAFDLMSARGLVARGTSRRAQSLLSRIIAMLTALVANLQARARASSN
jgi:four helix bundle protein